MSTEQFFNSPDQADVTEPTDERSRLSGEAIESLSFGNGVPANDKGSSDAKPIGLPELKLTDDQPLTSDQPIEQEQLDSQLGTAVKSGTVEDIQKVMESIDTPQEYATLQHSVESLNQEAPEGIKYRLIQMPSGEPLLIVNKSEPYSLDASKKLETTVEIGADIANGSTLNPGIIHNGGRLFLKPDAALRRIQKQS